MFPQCGYHEWEERDCGDPAGEEAKIGLNIFVQQLIIIIKFRGGLNKEDSRAN